MPSLRKVRMVKATTKVRGGFAIPNVPTWVKTPVAKIRLPKLAGNVVRTAVRAKTGSNLAAELAGTFTETGASAVLDKVGVVSPNIGRAAGLKVPIQEDSKILPTEDGLHLISGKSEGASMNHDNIRVIKFREVYRDGKKDMRLKLAKKLYGSTTVNYYSTLKSIVNRLYAYSGLNTKGIVWPYNTLAVPPAYTDIDTMSDTALNGSMGLFGESLADDALMLKKSLLANVASTSTLTDMPPIGAGDVDYFYPIQSWKNILTITNTNTYMSCNVKIYVLQAKRDTQLAPQIAWYSRSVGVSNKMNQNYVNVNFAETISGLSPTVYTESTIHPQAYPALSDSFKETYKIVNVRTFVLKASDMLEFTLEHHFANAYSAGHYNGRQTNLNYRTAGQLDLMIEFQGMPTPYYVSGATANTVAYSAMASCGFSKIRYTVDKYFTHSFPISNGLGLYNPTSSQYTPSFVGTSQRALTAFSDTAAYNANFSANPADLNKYLIPVTTESVKTFAQPLINDPL